MSVLFIVFLVLLFISVIHTSVRAGPSSDETTVVRMSLIGADPISIGRSIYLESAVPTVRIALSGICATTGHETSK